MGNTITAICLACCAFGRAFIFQHKKTTMQVGTRIAHTSSKETSVGSAQVFSFLDDVLCSRLSCTPFVNKYKTFYIDN